MKKFIVHPFLFALFPILSTASANIHKMLVIELFLPIVITLSCVSVLLLFAYLLTHNNYKSQLIVSLCIGFFFSYAHVLYLVWILFGRPNEAFFFVFWVILFVFSCYKCVKIDRPLENTTRVLNIFAVCAVVIPFIFIAKGLSARFYYEEEKNNLTPRVEAAENSPDIYYLVFDRYAGSNSLKDFFNYDNRSFINALKQRGFYIADNTKANYIESVHSLASSLNFEYLQDLTEKFGDNFKDKIPLYRKLFNHKIGRFLKSKGYKYIHIGSWYLPTKSNPNAEINIVYYDIPEFVRVLMQTSMLRPFTNKMPSFADFRKNQYERVLFKFNKLSGLSKTKAPKFVFAHMLIPHHPFVFNENGQFINQKVQQKDPDWKIRYIEQLKFLNKQIIELIDNLQNSENPPIIILQADEGPYPEYPDYDIGLNPALEVLNYRMRILNAYYLPSGKMEPAESAEGYPNQLVDTRRRINNLYPSISPVNTFRVVLNEYFGENLEILEDKSYLQTQEAPYKFVEVTDRLKKDSI